MASIGYVADVLLEQLERLNQDGMTEEQMRAEIDRSRAIRDTAQAFADVGRVALDAAKFKDNSISARARLPEMLS